MSERPDLDAIQYYAEGRQGAVDEDTLCELLREVVAYSVGLDAELAVAREQLQIIGRHRREQLDWACNLARRLAAARDVLLQINQWSTLGEEDVAPPWVSDLTARVLGETES